MHPLSYLFEDIYRGHWGIPRSDRPRRDAGDTGWRWPSVRRSLTDLSLERTRD